LRPQFARIFADVAFSSLFKDNIFPSNQRPQLKFFVWTKSKTGKAYAIGYAIQHRISPVEMPV